MCSGCGSFNLKVHTFDRFTPTPEQLEKLNQGQQIQLEADFYFDGVALTGTWEEISVVPGDGHRYGSVSSNPNPVGAFSCLVERDRGKVTELLDATLKELKCGT